MLLHALVIAGAFGVHGLEIVVDEGLQVLDLVGVNVPGADKVSPRIDLLLQVVDLGLKLLCIVIEAAAGGGIVAVFLHRQIVLHALEFRIGGPDGFEAGLLLFRQNATEFRQALLLGFLRSTRSALSWRIVSCACWAATR